MELSYNLPPTIRERLESLQGVDTITESVSKLRVKTISFARFSQNTRENAVGIHKGERDRQISKIERYRGWE